MRMHKREAKDSCRCKIPILFETFKGKCRLSEDELYFGTVFENQNNQIHKFQHFKCILVHPSILMPHDSHTACQVEAVVKAK